MKKYQYQVYKPWQGKGFAMSIEYSSGKDFVFLTLAKEIPVDGPKDPNKKPNFAWKDGNVGIKINTDEMGKILAVLTGITNEVKLFHTLPEKNETKNIQLSYNSEKNKYYMHVGHAAEGKELAKFGMSLDMGEAINVANLLRFASVESMVWQS
jgi:hypothetical protein